MSEMKMNALQRVLTALGHREPDRVPFFLLLTLHGAKELGLSIQDYFSKPEHVAEGQMCMRRKYRHDCLYSFFYAAVEIEAWGGQVIYCDNGPPNSGEPFVKHAKDIDLLHPPPVKTTACLQKVLNATRMLKEQAGGEVPIIGVVMSPFSLPVMQMGFEAYIRLILEEPERFQRLMAVNEAFCSEWANAQLEAGATAICYFDPVSSPTIIPRDLFLKTGYQVASRMIGRIQGPVATHLASGRCLPVIEDIVRTGASVIGVSALEHIADVKTACSGKITVLGNLNGIEMVHWDTPQTVAEVRRAMAQAGPGGGFVLSDNHGEIPYQVPESVLMAISETVHMDGQYPIRLTEG
jgi:uroporphyrinogen decarboxylase